MERYRYSDDRRATVRKRYGDIPCLVTFPDIEGSISAVIVDASPDGAFLRIYGQVPRGIPEDGSSGKLLIEHLKLGFKIMRSSARFGQGDTWMAVRFSTASEEFAVFLDDFIASRLRASPHQIFFEAKVRVEDASLIDAVVQFATLYVTIDAATHILLLLQQKEAVEPRPTIRPRLLRVSSFSPIKGAVEIGQGVMAVVKSADDLMRHRREQTQLKREEVRQAREQTRQEISKTSQEEAKTIVAETDALVRRFTADYDILNARIETLKKEVDLSRGEVTLYRERLAAWMEGWRFAKEVFGEESEELTVLKQRLLPAITWLIEDTAGLLLDIPLRPPDLPNMQRHQSEQS